MTCILSCFISFVFFTLYSLHWLEWTVYYTVYGQCMFIYYLYLIWSESEMICLLGTRFIVKVHVTFLYPYAMCEGAPEFIQTVLQFSLVYNPFHFSIFKWAARCFTSYHRMHCFFPPCVLYFSFSVLCILTILLNVWRISDAKQTVLRYQYLLQNVF